MVPHQPLDDRLGRCAQARLLPPRVGLRGHVVSGTAWAQHCLDEGEIDAEHVGNGALRAELPLAGPQDLLTSINRIGSHTSHAKQRVSYDQMKTAINELSTSGLRHILKGNKSLKRGRKHLYRHSRIQTFALFAMGAELTAVRETVTQAQKQLTIVEDKVKGLTRERPITVREYVHTVHKYSIGVLSLLKQDITHLGGEIKRVWMEEYGTEPETVQSGIGPARAYPREWLPTIDSLVLKYLGPHKTVPGWKAANQ
jgi:hypothetical protein